VLDTTMFPYADASLVSTCVGRNEWQRIAKVGGVYGQALGGDTWVSEHLKPFIHRALNQSLHTTGVGHTSRGKIAFIRASCLGADSTEIKEGRNDALNGNLNILESLKTEARNLAIKEAPLVYDDDAAIGNYPQIEIVMGPGGEPHHGNKKKPGTYRIGDKWRLARERCIKSGYIREEGGEGHDYYWQQGKYDDADKFHRNHKPVFAHGTKYLFTFFELDFFVEHRIKQKIASYP
jgi:hypothetical protein